MNDGFQGTRFAAVLEGAARDEARKRHIAQTTEDFERQQLLRYVACNAHLHYDALLKRIDMRLANPYELKLRQWELLWNASDGMFTVGRGEARAAEVLKTKGLALPAGKGRYRLTAEGARIARGEMA